MRPDVVIEEITEEEPLAGEQQPGEAFGEAAEQKGPAEPAAEGSGQGACDAAGGEGPAGPSPAAECSDQVRVV